MNHLRLVGLGRGPDSGPPAQGGRQNRWRIHLAFILAESVRTSVLDQSGQPRRVAPEHPPGGAAA
jgi:hypothetical protein